MTFFRTTTRDQKMAATDITDEARREGGGVLRGALWVWLVLLWLAYGICVSASLVVNSFSDPRQFYNRIIGKAVDASVPVVQANSMQVSGIAILALIAMAIGCLVLRPWRWRRMRAGQLYPSWYIASGLLAAIPLGLIVSLATPIEYVRDYGTYLKLAQSLYSTGDYSDFSEGNFTNPVADTAAWRPPGMALLYGLPIRLGIPVQMSVWLINALIATTVFFVVRRCLEKRQATSPPWLIVAGGVTICLTTSPFMLLPISHFPVIATLAVLLLLVPTESRFILRLSPLYWLLAGFLIGASALFRPNLVLEAAILATTILIAGVRFGSLHNCPRYLAALLACAIGVAIAIGPWTIRNWFVLHRFVPISTNGGMVFFSANGSPESTEQGRYTSRLAIKLYEDVPDEVDRDREGWKRGLQNIAAHPVSFVKSYIYRIPRLLANPLYPINYIREQARSQSAMWVLFFSETATLVSFWWLWCLMYVHRRAIREDVLDKKQVPWPQFSLLVAAFISSLFENSPTFQLSFLPFILFIWLHAGASLQAVSESPTHAKAR